MDTNDPILRRLPRNARPLAVLVGGVFCMITFGIVYTCGAALLSEFRSNFHIKVTFYRTSSPTSDGKCIQICALGN